MALKSICRCPTPPGGRAICESHQLAICRVRDGVAEAYCIDVPQEFREIQHDWMAGLIGRRGRRMANWALSHITGARRMLHEPLDVTDVHTLTTSSYLDPKTGARVTFRLPARDMRLWLRATPVGSRRASPRERPRQKLPPKKSKTMVVGKHRRPKQPVSRRKIAVVGKHRGTKAAANRKRKKHN